MNLDVRYLRMLVAIAETGNVTRAAQRLNLTQSALSHQLRDIESRLGVPLFRRTGRRMQLAEAGAHLLSTARGVLRQLEQAEAEVVASATGGPQGTLRIATECYTCYHWLPAVLERFRRAHARVEMKIVPEATRRPLRALVAGQLDVAIVTQKARTPRIQYVPLFRDDFVLIVPPDHPLARLPFVTGKDLAGEAVVLYDMPDHHSTLLSEFFFPAGLKPRSVTRVQLTEGVIELVKAGFGISAIARWAAAPHLETGALRAIQLGRNGYDREWMAAFRAHGAAPGYVRDFVKTLQAETFANVRSSKGPGRTLRTA